VSNFDTPSDLLHNLGLVADPDAFARENNAESWLYLCGADFAAMDGGMSYEQVQHAVGTSENIVADPPAPFDLDTVRAGIDALDRLPRPTLVTCRTGPRSSALVYIYAGLQEKATADEVLARAEADGAPFMKAAPLRDLVRLSIDELGDAS
jgi:hypothetical protein